MKLVLKFVVLVSKFDVLDHVVQVGFEVAEVVVMGRHFLDLNPAIVVGFLGVVAAVYVFFFVSFEEEGFPSHSLNHVFGFLYEVL